MSPDELRRRIRHYDDMAAVCSYRLDKALFRRQADELRERLAAAPEPRSFASS